MGVGGEGVGVRRGEEGGGDDEGAEDVVGGGGEDGGAVGGPLGAFEVVVAIIFGGLGADLG